MARLLLPPPGGQPTRACARPIVTRMRTTLRTLRSAGRGYTMLEISLGIAILGILAAIAIPTYDRYVERTRVAKAVLDIGDIAARISRYELDNREFPPSLAEAAADKMRDPWGWPYQYVNHDDPHSRGRWRRDKNIVPINDDFDVFS